MCGCWGFLWCWYRPCSQRPPNLKLLPVVLAYSFILKTGSLRAPRRLATEQRLELSPGPYCRVACIIIGSPGSFPFPGKNWLFSLFSSSSPLSTLRPVLRVMFPALATVPFYLFLLKDFCTHSLPRISWTWNQNIGVEVSSPNSSQLCEPRQVTSLLWNSVSCCVKWCSEVYLHRGCCGEELMHANSLTRLDGDEALNKL